MRIGFCFSLLTLVASLTTGCFIVPNDDPQPNDSADPSSQPQGAPEVASADPR